MARLVLLLSTCALVLSGCPGGFLSFGLGYDIAEQRITGSPLGGLLGAGAVVPIPLDIDLAAETESRDTGPAQHVFLTELSFSVTSTAEGAGDTDSFDFLDTVDIFVESRAAGSSLPRVHVAGLSSVPDGARTISLAVDGVDIIAYVREGARLTANATGTTPPDDVTFDGHYAFVVEVLP